RPSTAVPALLFALALVVAVLPGGAAEAQTGPGVNILRADYFTNYSGTFVNIEAKADVDTPQQASALTVTATINGQTYPLSAFNDAGEYMYHRTSSPRPIPAPPVGQSVTVTVHGGGSDTEPMREWIPGGATGEQRRGRAYEEGFHDRYL